MSSPIPRHLAQAIASATRAFQAGDLSRLGTANENLQPLLDAAIAWGRRTRTTSPTVDVDVDHLRELCRQDLPAPVPGGALVRDHLDGLPELLRVVAQTRLDLGVERYGAHLAANDKRGSADALQEAGDLVNYLLREELGGDQVAGELCADLQPVLLRLIMWAVARTTPPHPEGTPGP